MVRMFVCVYTFGICNMGMGGLPGMCAPGAAGPCGPGVYISGRPRVPMLQMLYQDTQ